MRIRRRATSNSEILVSVEEGGVLCVNLFLILVWSEPSGVRLLGSVSWLEYRVLGLGTPAEVDSYSDIACGMMGTFVSEKGSSSEGVC